MDSLNHYVKGCDGWELYFYEWNEVDNPIAAIQIIHGLAEHAGRYEPLARFLNKQGFAVYANDNRGHGKSSKSVDELGYIGKDGFNRSVEDAHLITEHIRQKHPGLPIYLFAHSNGSFMGQDYITRFGKDISGVILSGSSAKRGGDVKAGILVSTIQRLIFGERKKAKLINKLAFGQFNKGIANPATPADWLSRDPEEVKKYCDDQFCGTVFPIGFYYYLFRSLNSLYSPEKLNNIPKELPIFIFSGDKDPVGAYGEAVKKLYEIYAQLGIKDVELKLYPGGRHEMFNETNREEVYRDIANWLNKRVQA